MLKKPCLITIALRAYHFQHIKKSPNETSYIITAIIYAQECVEARFASLFPIEIKKTLNMLMMSYL